MCGRQSDYDLLIYKIRGWGTDARKDEVSLDLRVSAVRAKVLLVEDDEAVAGMVTMLGVNDYIGKPFNAAELAERVKRLLKGR